MAEREVHKVRFTKRSRTGKGVCRKLRVDGIVPAVFYGPEYKESVVGTVDAKEIGAIANGPNWETNMLDLELEGGKTEMALIRDIKRHAITRKILHVDLYQLVRGRKVRVDVPVRCINKDICQGVKMGGMLDQPVREIEMHVLPREIPSEIVIDVSKMAMGSEVFVRDLELPESADLMTHADSVVVMVTRPKSLTVAAEEEEGEGSTEVEVVGKGKKKEDEEA